MSGSDEQQFFSDRPQTLAEDVMNVVTHSLGLVLALIAFAVLLQEAIATEDAYRMVSVILFSASLIMMFLSSIAFHSTRMWPRLKEIFQLFDHVSVYWLIAGTYSPFLLVNLRGHWGWTAFIIIWLMAILGTIYKCCYQDRFPKLSLLSYLVMGWVVVLILGPFFQYVDLAGIAWLFAGGIFYSVGAFFYAWEGPRFNHAIWHLFTIAGMLCHVVAVLYYVVLSS